MFDYVIPDDIKQKIPEYFSRAFAGELLGVFGPDVVTRDEDGVYGVCFHGGTIGWHEAFKATCDKLDMQWLYNYYEALEWHESDQFDGEMETSIIDFFEGDHSLTSPYYLYLIGR